VLAYSRENEDLDADAWGYEVVPGMTSYSWTKLLLDRNAPPSESDDPELKNVIHSGMLKVPRGKKPVDVVSDYLGCVYRMFWSVLVEKLGGSDILDVTPMEFWLTVPAIWSDEAKFATRDAAKRAGFGARPGDQINLISEPEAAAHLALKSSLSAIDDLVKVCGFVPTTGTSATRLTSFPQKNTGVLVCDCGGGTVVSFIPLKYNV
jgi:hypothetical protein